MDYRAFLAPRAPLVLPYLGGSRVDAPDRRLRVDAPLAPGWWRFRIDGRRAIALEPAAPADLAALPALRGHFVDGWVVASGRELGHLALPPEDEPAPLARVTARRWHSGDWLFESVDFEDDAEVEARRALEERRPLAGVRGVVPSLRAAFGYALGLAAARDLELALSIRELQPAVVEIAEGGAGVVRRWFDELVEVRRREQAAQRERERARRLADTAAQARALPRHGGARERCDDVLADANARLVGFRRLDGGAQVEVTYTVDGTRVISVVDPATLAVIDPGVCLGHDDEHRELTLDAMPSVIREAVDTGRLNILRH